MTQGRNRDISCEASHRRRTEPNDRPDVEEETISWMNTEMNLMRTRCPAHPPA